MLILKQTDEQRDAIKKHIKNDMPNDVSLGVIDSLIYGTKFIEKESKKDFYLIEVQLRGCLVENKLRRRYVSYQDLENYEVSND